MYSVVLEYNNNNILSLFMNNFYYHNSFSDIGYRLTNYKWNIHPIMQGAYIIDLHW